jgi:hypothetical protein
MGMLDTLPALKEGYWFYAGLKLCPLRIVSHHTLFGTHDPEDPPELSTDKEKKCFYILYHRPGESDQWREGGVALSLREAMFIAQRNLGPAVQWNN